MFLIPFQKSKRSRPLNSPHPHKFGSKGLGFTLLEMVIAVGIFAVVMTILTEIFLLTNKAQHKSAGLLAAQAEARYALEAISRKIRSGFIFYDHYPSGSPASPETEFAVVDLADNGTVFTLETNPLNCPSPESGSCIKMLSDLGGTGTTTQYLTGKGLKVENLDFYVIPQEDPFVSVPVADSQPRVTIVMTIESTSNRPEEIAASFLQTTVSTRYYKR